MNLFKRIFKRSRQSAVAEESGKLTPPLSELAAPITDEELRILAAFLQQHDVHRGYLDDIYALDGFLTCINIGPDAIPAEAWMSAIFAYDFDDIDADNINLHWPLIGMLYQRIAMPLHKHSPTYLPLFETHLGLGQSDRLPLKAWCEGFMTAIILCDEQWKSMLLKSGTSAWLYPILECASVDEKNPSKRTIPSNKVRTLPAFGVVQLKKNVLKIHGYWTSHLQN